MAIQIEVDKEKIADFCRRWKIAEFALFGSVLRDDFGPDSDVDVLATFDADAHWTLFDWARMIEELKAILGREVDLLSRRGVEAARNPLRRKAILSSLETIHVSRH